MLLIIYGDLKHWLSLVLGSKTKTKQLNLMKKSPLTVFLAGAIVIMGLTAWQVSHNSVSPSDAKSEQAFVQMMSVIKHQRCMNCHPTDDRPRQSDDRHVHLFGVQRGKDNHGLPTMRCNTCHQSENNRYSNVPGAPHWHLAPKSMGWQGLTDAQIGQSMLDKSKNGGKSLEEIVKHMTEDSLVQWAWNPGRNRTLPPLSQTEFHKAVKDWAENGAKIPAK
jgi:hypothetical protein